MIKKSFLGILKPRLEYQIIDVSPPEPQEIAASTSVQLFAETGSTQGNKHLVKAGDPVKAGQKLTLFEGRDDYVTATAAGTISGVAPFAGDFGTRITSVTIDISGEKEVDGQFKEIAESPTRENARNFLACLPGGVPPALFSDGEQKVSTLLIMGMDSDLLTLTQQYIVKTSAHAIKAGIKALKEAAGVEKVYIAVPETLSQDAIATGAAVQLLSPYYPSASPRLVLNAIFGKEVPADQSFEDMGVAVMSAEAVAAFGQAYDSGQLPGKKVITVVDKAGRMHLVSAVIGTPLKDIFSALNITANNEDRVVAGGPMTGAAVFTEDHPVREDTDAVMIQDNSIIPTVSDNACINCGECIRACPVNVPVNMLVRFLEAGEYLEGADNYDLYACIECGLCSYVCTARMPVFQYIKLAKHEIARIQEAEAENV